MSDNNPDNALSDASDITRLRELLLEGVASAPTKPVDADDFNELRDRIAQFSPPNS